MRQHIKWLKIMAGGWWATDRKRRMKLSQHCWFCSALIKVCWQRKRKLWRVAHQAAVGGAARQLKTPKDISASQPAVFWPSQKEIKGRRLQNQSSWAGSHFFYICEASSPSRCFSMTHLFWTEKKHSNRKEKNSRETYRVVNNYTKILRYLSANTKTQRGLAIYRIPSN